MKTVICGLLCALALPAWAGVSASSEGATSDGENHPASAAVDGRLDTAWAEGEEGSGVGAWIELSLDRLTDVESVSIWPGRIDRGSRGLREHGRPHTVTVKLLGGPEEIEVQQRVLDIADTGPVRLDVGVKGQAKKIRITLDEAYAGGIYSQTYITEIAVNYAGGPVHPSVQKQLDWEASDAGQKAAAKHVEQVDELKAAIAAEELGDRDAFAELAAAAAEGADYLQERAKRGVPDGYRVAVTPASLPALNALLELEDAKGIASLELAATRAIGPLAVQLRDRVSRFGALAELKGGGKRNVVPYGETGFTKGCLRGLGEPLDLTVDNFGGVWIADFGNHRVQRFNFDGIGQQTVGGGEPALSNQFLGRTRDWYVSGNTAGVGNGSFVLPVGIDVVPDKKAGDGLLVLDASGTVTRLDSKGGLVASWSLGTEDPLSPNLGGEAHIALVKKSVVVTWGNEAYVFDLDGQLQNKFTLEDGVGAGLVGFANGKFGVIFEDRLVLFSTDGFRHGDVLQGTVPKGFETFDVTLDAKGKLWVITDTGYAIKYKTPGKVDFQVKLADYSFSVPRADVYDDLVFVTDKDGFKKFDALELKAKQEAE